MDVRSFTISHNGIASQLMSNCHISKPYDPTKGTPHPKQQEYQGLWDTGATGSVINKKIVDDLGLKPISKVKVHHADGESEVNLYLVNLCLPNGVCFKYIRVTEGILTGFDVLIGMDIIGKGDFAVTNKDNKTKFSFRVPSIESIDFTKKTSNGVKYPPAKNKYRNVACPCGSGKKYKDCHFNKILAQQKKKKIS